MVVWSSILTVANCQPLLKITLLILQIFISGWIVHFVWKGEHSQFWWPIAFVEWYKYNFRVQKSIWFEVTKLSIAQQKS